MQQREIKPLKLVPFHPQWVAHDKIDIHAIYRRPRFVQDHYGDWSRENVNGLPTWDITGPLPVKQHNVWVGKGFEYVTLSDRESLIVAAKTGTLLDVDPETGQNVLCSNWKVYDQHQSGPWNWRRYHEGQAQTTTLAEKQLIADVERFGSDAVEAIRRQTDSTFALPDHLQGIPAGGKVPTGAPPADLAPQGQPEAAGRQAVELGNAKGGRK